MPLEQRKEVFTKLAKIISEITDISIEKIEETSSCYLDIGLESFDIMDINFRIEQEFGIEMDQNVFWNLKTVMQDPESFTVDNEFTDKGMNEIRFRIPELSIDKDASVSMEEFFSALQVKDIVDFILSAPAIRNS